MKSWRLVMSACVVVLAMTGCGDDGGDDGMTPTDAGMGGVDSGGGGDTDAGGGETDAGMAMDDAGGGETDAGGGETDAGGGDTDAGGGGGVSFASDVWPILQGSCSGCHGASGGLNLGGNAANAYDALVGPDRVAGGGCSGPTELVTPGDPDDSFLVTKIEAELPAACGLRMPRNGPPYLTPAQITTIRTWISEGAMDN